MPQDFEIPSVSLQIAFQLWCLGDGVKEYPPFRQLEPDDLGSDQIPAQKKKRRRLSDLGTVMGRLEKARMHHVPTTESRSST